jgi:uncharacterized membrane protein
MIEKNKRRSSKKTFGEKMADGITEVIGSWTFIIIQSVILVIWIIINLLAWVNHWDPYPFILLNLALSFQAAYAAPIIMMSQNRSASMDRRKAGADLATDRRTERRIIEIQKQLNRLENNKLAKTHQAVEGNSKK